MASLLAHRYSGYSDFGVEFVADSRRPCGPPAGLPNVAQRRGPLMTASFVYGIVTGTWNSRVDSPILPTKTAAYIIAAVDSRPRILSPKALGAVTVVPSPAPTTSLSAFD